MRTPLLSLCLPPALLLAGPLLAAEDSTDPKWPHQVVLDGEKTPARWDDGDTFSVPGQEEGDRYVRFRLAGYNTLESYGPIHRWGEWSAEELYAFAGEAGEVAGSKAWACTVSEGGGGYGRKSADCPELRRELLRRGLAHVFVVDGEPDAEDLAVQQKAISGGAGMWAKGAPVSLVTSVHSLDEREDQTETYNRVTSTRTGRAEKQPHSQTWTACQEVCVGDAPPEGDGSCMVYVPYRQRYGEDKAACLQVE